MALLPKFGEGSSVRNLTVVELKGGRNLRGWFDLEEGAIFSCGVASSLLQRSKLSVFRKKRKSDVGQLHRALDDLTWTNQEKTFILQTGRKCLILGKNLCLASVVHHGWDVWMLQEQEQ